MTRGLRSKGGFTLIEVVGALVIFAAGVLIAAELAAVLSKQVERAALRSEVAAITRERFDSLGRIPYDTLSAGTWVQSLTIRGRSYVCSTVVADAGTRVRSIRVSVSPSDAVGPSQGLSSYVYEAW